MQVRRPGQVSEALARLRSGDGSERDISDVQDRLRTIDRGARCFLATQHQLVVGSLLALFPDLLDADATGRSHRSGPYLIAELEDLVPEADGYEALVDVRHADKQPDWSYDAEPSGQSPADRLDQEMGEVDLDQ